MRTDSVLGVGLSVDSSGGLELRRPGCDSLRIEPFEAPALAAALLLMLPAHARPWKLEVIEGVIARAEAWRREALLAAVRAKLPAGYVVTVESDPDAAPGSMLVILKKGVSVDLMLGTLGAAEQDVRTWVEACGAGLEVLVADLGLGARSREAAVSKACGLLSEVVGYASELYSKYDVLSIEGAAMAASDEGLSCEVHNARVAQTRLAAMLADDWQPSYSAWRHGGWYVHSVVYPSGACGCVSRNYPDGRWRVVCARASQGEAPTYASRDAAAAAERELALAMWAAEVAGARDHEVHVGAGVALASPSPSPSPSPV